MPTAKTSAPHIRSKNSVPQLMWTVGVSLVPAVVTKLVLLGPAFFRVLVIAVATGLLAEMGIEKLLNRRVTLYDGSALVAMLLYGLLIPSHVPSWLVALGAAFGMIFGKQIFGGLGQNPFNPAMAACAWIFLAVPSTDFLPHITEVPHSLGLAVSVLAGGGMLLFRRVIHWEIPLLYLTGFVLFSLLGPRPQEAFLSWPLLLSAFFVVTDPVTTPVTRMGESWFSLAAGLLTAILSDRVGMLPAISGAVLGMNALTPWLDRKFRPSGPKRVPAALHR